MSDEILHKERKTVQCILKLSTGIDNFELCSCIERILNSSLIGSAEYKLEIEETKVIKTENEN